MKLFTTVTRSVVASILLAGVASGPAIARNTQPETSAPGTVTQARDDQILVMVVFKLDQTMTVEEILEQARSNGFYKNFSPENATVVSWTSAMGLGQLVTLRLPAADVRELNRAIEFGAWGAFSTEIYLTYDFQKVAQRLHAEAFAKQELDQ